MNDQDFMALNTEVERLKMLHEQAISDATLTIGQKTSIAGEYTERHRELQTEALRRVVEYRDV